MKGEWNAETFYLPVKRGGECEKNGVGCEINVKIVRKKTKKKTLYEGETGRNGFTREKEHLSALGLENEENPLWKNCLLKYEG